MSTWQLTSPQASVLACLCQDSLLRFFLHFCAPINALRFCVSQRRHLQRVATPRKPVEEKVGEEARNCRSCRKGKRPHSEREIAEERGVAGEELRGSEEAVEQRTYRKKLQKEKMRWQWWKKSRVACAMIAVQLAFAGMNIVSKVAMSAGLPFYVLVVYRHAVATVALAPFAYFLERKTRPRLSGRVLMEIFTSALLGSSLNQNLYYAGMHYTSPTFVCALANMVPAITFLMALLFRMEKLALRSAAGQAKVIGTTVTVAGGMIITLYKGPALNLWKSSLNVAPSVATSHPNYSPMKGALLALGSCICFSCWFIVQAKIGSSYSAQYTSITLMFFFATIQATVGALLFQHSRPSVWKMGWDSKLLAVIYSGVVCSAMGFMLMAWCIRKKGPLIVTMFTPFQLIMVALLSSVFLRDKLHLGSVAGSLLIIAGVYSVVWAKTKEFNSQKKQIPTTAMSNNKIICAPSEDYDNVADGASVAAGEERNPDCDDAKPGSAGDSTVLVGVRVVVGGGDGRTEAGRRGESDER